MAAVTVNSILHFPWEDDHNGEEAIKKEATEATLTHEIQDLEKLLAEKRKEKEEMIKRQSNPDIDRYETLVDDIESTLRSGYVSKRDPQAETRRLIQLTIQPFLHNLLKIVKTQDLKIHELNMEVKKLKSKKD